MAQSLLFLSIDGKKQHPNKWGLFFILAWLFPVCSFFHIRPPAKDIPVIIDTLATHLTVPWDICFLPSGDMIFTERSGQVRLYRKNKLIEKPLLQVPGIEVNGKMGLLSLVLHPLFNENHFLYLAFNYRRDNLTFLKVVRYCFKNDTPVEPLTICKDIPAAFNHTGSRLLFGPDKKLYISTGDADVPRLAQDLKTFNGKILRVNEDGSIPFDNPFVDMEHAKHEIWSYGHRNPQGLVFQPRTGYLFSSEHGPTGGDEINIISRGGNYGWPVIHHRERNPSMFSPILEFSPSIGPSEIIFYTGKAFPELKGHLLTACMRGEAILNVSMNENKPVAYNFLLKNRCGRIRALTEGPDGCLYISTTQVDPPESKLKAGEQGFDMILRIRPAKSKELKNAITVNASGALNQALNTSSAFVKKPSGEKAISIQYNNLCAGCHGEKMEGKDGVGNLVDDQWIGGDSRAAIQNSINEGLIYKGMPAWRGVLTVEEVNAMTKYILKHGK